MGQPNLTCFDPAFADEVALIMEWSFDHMQRDAGGSVYLRLSTRSIPQIQRDSEDWKGDALRGGYWLKRPPSLAEKARAGKLTPQDYLGGTASLSHLGMFGIDEMVPVINPPQALILGTAAGIRQPWDVNGEIALATIMAATGSFDHRAIDGAVAARFMAAFKQLVEAPMSLLL